MFSPMYHFFCLVGLSAGLHKNCVACVVFRWPVPMSENKVMGMQINKIEV